MYSLLKAIWSVYFQKPTYKILIIGLNESGKTYFLTRLKKNASQNHISFDKIISTVGLNKYKQHNCLYWDLGGAPNLRKIWKKYYPDSHGIIFVVDSNFKERKEELISCFQEMVHSPDNAGTPILVLLNKIDQLQSEQISIEDQLKTQLSVSMIKGRQIIFSQCSSLNGQNIEESLQKLFECISKLFK